MSSAKPLPTAKVSGISPPLLLYDMFRQYVQNNYLDIKKQNPEFPFIVRECTNAQPTIMARYDYGVEKRVYVPDLSEQDVDNVVKELVEQAKEVNSTVQAKRF